MLNPVNSAWAGGLIQLPSVFAPSVDQTSGLHGQSRALPKASSRSLAQAAPALNSRERFINEYQRYRDQVEPALTNLHLKNWAPEDLTRIHEQVDAARKKFQSGDYQAAYANLNDAIMRVEAIAAEYESRLADYIDSAHQAYHKGQVSEAYEQVARGLRLAPDHVELIELKSRIRVLDAVTRLLNEANQAHAANQKERELAALEEIVRIDPQHLEAQKRIENLNAERLHQAYADAIAMAGRALDDDNIEEAKRHMQRANKIKPGNQDVKRLQDRIAKIETEQKYFKQITSALLASREDDWVAAAGHYQQALKVKPYDEVATESLNDANAMLAMIESLEQTLKYERRFVNAHAIKAANGLLVMTKPYLGQSEQLKSLHFAIIEKLQFYSMETEVIIISDNKTEVVVKGVGIVGRILQHTIRLKPGVYQLEGSRQNYKSTIVPITVSPHAGPIEVEVICSERI